MYSRRHVKQFIILLYALRGTQGRLENLTGPGQDIKVGPPYDMMTALIKDLTVLLEYIDIFGPAKRPSCPSCRRPCTGTHSILSMYLNCYMMYLQQLH